MGTEFSLVDALPGLVWTALPDGAADFINHRWSEYTGMSLKEAIGPGWLSAIHPDDLAHLLGRWGEFLASGRANEVEARLRRHDGVYRWFLFSAAPITDEDGQIIKWCGINTDIDDRKQAEELRRSLLSRERDLKTIINAVPVTAWSTGPDGYVEFLSDRWLNYAGITAEEGAGLGWGKVIHPDDAPGLFQYWQSCLETGTPVDVEARMRRFDGEYRWFLFRANPLRDENGVIVKWFGTNIDIEDRKRADTQLAGENQLLDMIASGRTLRDILEALCQFVEDISPDCLCGVYPIDWSGPTFQYGVAPSLPPSYVDPIAGWPVRKDVAPCGIAAFEKRQVIVTDVETDPIWAGTEYRNHVVGHGLRSVWSTPICSLDGRVLGTFCVYKRKPATPSPHEQELLSHATHMVAIALDRAQTDAELRRINGYLEEGQRLTLTGTVVADLVADDHNWSEEAYRIFEFDLTEKLIFARIRERLHPDDVSLVESVMQGTPQGGTFDFECRLKMPTGTIKYIHVVGRRTDDQPGQRVFLACMQDITERKLVEQELRRSRGFLAEGQRISATGSFTWCITADEIAWSDEVYRIFGYDPATPMTLELIGARVHPDDVPMLVDMIDRAKNEGSDFEYEHRLLFPDNSIKYLHMSAHGTRDQNGRMEYVGSVQDITVRKLAEEALGKARSELAHVARVSALGTLTASITHEINQPLSGIVTNAGTCLRMLAANPPNVEGARETAERTIRDANRASQVITRLRALFTRKTTANDSVDLNEATREVIALSANELQRSRVLVKAELAEDLPTVVGDRVQLQQVILNLLLNAIDAMSGTEDRPRQLTIRTHRDESGGVCVAVRDAGVGFDAQEAERLFDAFHTTKVGGMGIGLSVSRSIVETHSGRLWADRNDGPGATFSFSIPARSSDECQHLQRSSQLH
jgi:PAS domain S-box-containing protein